MDYTANFQNLERMAYQRKKNSVIPTCLLISELGLSNEIPLLSSIRIALNPRIHQLPDFQSQPKHFNQYVPVSGRPLLSLDSLLIITKSGKTQNILRTKCLFVCWSCQASARAFLALLCWIIYSLLSKGLASYVWGDQIYCQIFASCVSKRGYTQFV